MAIFTLDEARDLLPEVKEITDYYHRRVTELKQQAKDTESDEKERELIQQLNYNLSSWVEEINGLGASVTGPWIVDFDSGDGIYYCWKYGEESLNYFHRYQEGFDRRRPLEDLKGSRS